MTNSTSCAVHSNLNSKIWRHYGDNSQKQVRNPIARIFPLSFSLSSSPPLFFSSLDSCHIFVKVAARIGRAKGGRGEMWAQDWKFQELRVLKVQPRNQPRGGARTHRPLQGLCLWLGAGSLVIPGDPMTIPPHRVMASGTPVPQASEGFHSNPGTPAPCPGRPRWCPFVWGAGEVTACNCPAQPSGPKVGDFNTRLGRASTGGPPALRSPRKSCDNRPPTVTTGAAAAGPLAASRNSHSPGSTGGRPVHPSTTLCPLRGPFPVESMPTPFVLLFLSNTSL